MTDDDLDETTYPAWRDRIATHRPDALALRSYPGHPRTALPPATTPRFGAPSLDRVLRERRSAAALDEAQPPLRDLGRVLGLAHGITGPESRGPTPSAGGLQALELYLAVWSSGALAPGYYHYDRAAHALAQLVAGATRDEVAALVPSLGLYRGGALLAILAGDHPRVAARYGARAGRFLLLEAGGLLQNLCLLSTAVGLCTVPLGGSFDRALARRLLLPRGDRVLVVGVTGAREPRA